jgi:hypothetical protein
MSLAFLVFVIVGLDPAIHGGGKNLTSSNGRCVDARVKSGNDEERQLVPKKYQLGTLTLC